MGPAATLGYGGYPLVLGGALLAAWAAMTAGIKPEQATGAAVLAVAALCFVAEKLLPYTQKWRPASKSIALDLTHSLLWPVAMAPFVRAGALALVVAVGSALHRSRSTTPWPDDWPLAVQVILAIIAADFGAYWGHRLMHLTRAGWRAHAVHHSPDKLHFLVAGRTHPFNVAITLGCESLLLFALGVGPETLALVTVFKGSNGLLQHSNIDLRPGLLSHIIATNECHWWHHSVKLDESNRNFGNTTMVWDRLFGTFFMPADRAPRHQVGVEDAAIPAHFLSHMLTPFLLQRYEQQVAEQAASDDDRAAAADKVG